MTDTASETYQWKVQMGQQKRIMDDQKDALIEKLNTARDELCQQVMALDDEKERLLWDIQKFQEERKTLQEANFAFAQENDRLKTQNAQLETRFVHLEKDVSVRLQAVVESTKRELEGEQKKWSQVGHLLYSDIA